MAWVKTTCISFTQQTRNLSPYQRDRAGWSYYLNASAHMASNTPASTLLTCLTRAVSAGTGRFETCNAPKFDACFYEKNGVPDNFRKRFVSLANRRFHRSRLRCACFAIHVRYSVDDDVALWPWGPLRLCFWKKGISDLSRSILVVYKGIVAGADVNAA